MKYESLCMLCACAKTKEFVQRRPFLPILKNFFLEQTKLLLFYPVNSDIIISLSKFNSGWTFN